MSRRRSLKQIRSLAESLRLVLERGLPIPDARDLTMGDRFSIILRLVPTDRWPEVLGRSVAHIRRYEIDASQLPLSVAVRLTDQTRVPLTWLACGGPLPVRRRA